MRTITPLRRLFIISICLIWGYFLLGLALSHAIGMRPDQDLGALKLLEKLAEVELGGFLLQASPTLIVAVLLLPFVRSRWRRFEKFSIGIALGGFVIAGLIVGAVPISALLYLPILAISVLCEVITGQAEGEAYNEGWVCVSAVGWWLMAWGAAGLYKLIKLIPDSEPSKSTAIPDPGQ